MTEDEMNRLKSTIGQLRHAYKQLAAGTVVNQKQFAEGLISPAIRTLEKLEGAWNDY